MMGSGPGEVVCYITVVKEASNSEAKECGLWPLPSC